MDAIAALTQRASVAKLQAPGPTDEQMQVLLKAAVRAADHGLIRPWRFLRVEGEGREKLGELFVRAGIVDKPDLGQPQREKLAKMPLRAPCLLLVIACVQDHPKVPAQEQIISAGAAAQNIINAAFAMGLGAMWRTGDMAYHPEVRDALGLAESEELVGYLYLGTPANKVPEPRVPAIEPLLQDWP